MQVELSRLRHLVAVAAHRSFTRAAEQLHISQPALSRSVSEFERRAGVRVFDRRRGGIELTAVGRLVVAEAEDLLQSADGIDLNLKLYAKGEGGSVSVGFGPLLASLVLPELGRKVLSSSPSVRLNTIIRSTDSLIDDLLKDRIEAIFGSSALMQAYLPELEVETLGELSIDFIVRATHPLAGRRDLAMADLQPYSAATATTLPRFDNLPPAAGLVCDNFEILRDLTLETDCIWVACTDLVRDHIAAGRLVRLDVADRDPAFSDLSFIWRRGRTLSPGLLAIAGHIRGICEGIGGKGPAGSN